MALLSAHSHKHATCHVPAAQVGAACRIPADAALRRRTFGADGPEGGPTWQKTKQHREPPLANTSSTCSATVWARGPCALTGPSRRSWTAARRPSSNTQGDPDRLHHQGHARPQAVWGLVLFGVMVSVVLDCERVVAHLRCRRLYLPIASSAPIFVRGLVPAGWWTPDAAPLREHNLDEAALAHRKRRARGCVASGYIAGGAIAVWSRRDHQPGFEDRHMGRQPQPIFAGPWYPLIPFLMLVGILYRTGRNGQAQRRGT